VEVRPPHDSVAVTCSAATLSAQSGEDSGESVAMKMAMGVAMLFNQKVDVFVGSCSLVYLPADVTFTQSGERRGHLQAGHVLILGPGFSRITIL
jgi:hypothetical protein